MIKGCIFDLFGVICKDFSKNESNSIDYKSVTPDDLTDGFFVFLKELKNKSIQIAVVSDYPNLKEILDRLRITHLINIYLSKDQIDNSVLDVYHSAAILLNLNPEELILFKNECNLLESFIDDRFNVISVGTSKTNVDKYFTISDFSSAKFNQLVLTISNLK